jgi:hypothetical protein
MGQDDYDPDLALDREYWDMIAGQEQAENPLGLEADPDSSLENIEGAPPPPPEPNFGPQVESEGYQEAGTLQPPTVPQGIDPTEYPYPAPQGEAQPGPNLGVRPFGADEQRLRQWGRGQPEPYVAKNAPLVDPAKAFTAATGNDRLELARADALAKRQVEAKLVSENEQRRGHAEADADALGDVIAKVNSVSDTETALETATQLEASSNLHGYQARKKKNVAEDRAANKAVGITKDVATGLKGNRDAAAKVIDEVDGKMQEKRDQLDKGLDPSRVWANMSTGKKVAVGLGVLISSISRTRTGSGKNGMLDTIDGLVKQDMEVQRDEYKRGLQKIKLYGNERQRAINRKALEDSFVKEHGAVLLEGVAADMRAQLNSGRTLANRAQVEKDLSETLRKSVKLRLEAKQGQLAVKMGYAKLDLINRKGRGGGPKRVKPSELRAQEKHEWARQDRQLAQVEKADVLANPAITATSVNLAANGVTLYSKDPKTGRASTRLKDPKTNKPLRFIDVGDKALAATVGKRIRQHVDTISLLEEALALGEIRKRNPWGETSQMRRQKIDGVMASVILGGGRAISDADVKIILNSIGVHDIDKVLTLVNGETSEKMLRDYIRRVKAELRGFVGDRMKGDHFVGLNLNTRNEGRLMTAMEKEENQDSTKSPVNPGNLSRDSKNIGTPENFEEVVDSLLASNPTSNLGWKAGDVNSPEAKAILGNLRSAKKKLIAKIKKNPQWEDTYDGPRHIALIEKMEKKAIDHFNVKKRKKEEDARRKYEKEKRENPEGKPGFWTWAKDQAAKLEKGE